MLIWHLCIFPMRCLLRSMTHFLIKLFSLVAQSCLTLCDPLDYSPPGFPVHGILQARILKWVAIPFSRGSSWLRNWTHVSCISCVDRRILYHWAPWGALLRALYRLWLTVLSWRIPGTEEPGGLPSMGSHRVGHDWRDLAAATVLYQIWHLKIFFSQSMARLLIPLALSFTKAKFSILMKFSLSVVSFMDHIFGGVHKKTSPYPRSSRFSPLLSYKRLEFYIFVLYI